MVARKARIIAIASTLASSAAFTSTAHAAPPPADPSDEPPRSPMFRNGAILLPVGLLFGATAGGLVLEVPQGRLTALIRRYTSGCPHGIGVPA